MFQPFSFGKGFGFEEFIIDAETLGLTSLGSSVSISGNGNLIVSNDVSSGTLYTFEGNTTIPYGSIAKTPEAYYPSVVVISKDGSTIAASDKQYNSNQGIVYTFNVSDGSDRSTIPNVNPSLASYWGDYNLELSSDGSIVQIPVPLWAYTGGYRGRIYQYNTSDASFEDRFGDDLDPGITNINFAQSSDLSGNGSIIVSGAYGYNSGFGAVYTYFKSSGVYYFTESPTPNTNYNFGWKVSISEDGSKLAVSEPNNGRGKVYIFDVDDIESSYGSSASPILTISHPDTVSGGSFGAILKMSGDGSTVLCGSSNRKIYAISVSDGSPIRTLTAQELDPTFVDDVGFGNISSIDISHNGKRVAVGFPNYHPGSYNFYGGIFMFNL